MPPGSTELTQLLGSLDAQVRPGEYVYVTLPPGTALPAGATATVVEDEGVTCVLPRADAERAGIAYEFVAAWLTLTVHSSLEAVGLTAAFATALADAGISCNVLAGYHHDHLLVPADQTQRALGVLRHLSERHARA